jgi:hypothetical protein
MERLSISSYHVKRHNPSLDTLQFQIDDGLATSIAGMSLQQSLDEGRLFYANDDQMDPSPPMDSLRMQCTLLH